MPNKHSASIEVFEGKTDIEIWKDFNNGDEIAFNYIYRLNVENMFHFGTQFTDDHLLVQDSIQNIFIFLRKKRGELSEVKSIKAYLFKILQRKLIREITRDNGKKKVLAGVMDDNLFSIEVSHETKLIQSEKTAELQNKLQSALDQLTPRQRQAILLLYHEGMNYSEVAEVMELHKVKSARKIIYRALARLKELLVE
ncbi:RNA polymerase sigma factor [Negadavirga shengliensis]|uniref:RNA polymerase sigma factor n=1 Tax=Negadavirga shengliensis TaxID=1389218 RepID=A0ABV9T8N2_9BACT